MPSRRVVASIRMALFWSVALSIVSGIIGMIAVRMMNEHWHPKWVVVGNWMLFGAGAGFLGGAGFALALSRLGQHGVDKLPMRRTALWGTLLGGLAGVIGFVVISIIADGVQSLSLGAALWFAVATSVLGWSTSTAVVMIAQRGKALPGEGSPSGLIAGDGDLLGD